MDHTPDHGSRSTVFVSVGCCVLLYMTGRGCAYTVEAVAATQHKCALLRLLLAAAQLIRPSNCPDLPWDGPASPFSAAAGEGEDGRGCQGERET